MRIMMRYGPSNTANKTAQERKAMESLMLAKTAAGILDAKKADHLNVVQILLYLRMVAIM